MLSQKDIEILRELAQKYMQCAVSPQQEEVQKLWIAHNNGCGQRPMVLIDQIPWEEMDVDGSLQCKIQDPYWQSVEQYLRRKLYQYKHMRADMFLPGYIVIPRKLKDPDFRSFGVNIHEKIIQRNPSDSVVSHAYEKQFNEMDDIKKIKHTILGADKDAEAEIMDYANKIFDGISSVRFQGVTLHCGLWDAISMWQGVEEIYFMLMDHPELLHAMMERMTQIVLEWIDQGNAEGLFVTPEKTCHCSNTIKAALDIEDANDNGMSQNSWAFGMAQVFSSVSPEVTKEFEVPYMKRIFEKFGNVYYGCCEKLDDRLDILSELPNVRKISCSPWSDPYCFARNLSKGIIMSNKPNPALAASGNMDAARDELIRTIDAAQKYDRTLEMILKDNSSVHGHPERLWEFEQMAMKVVCK